MKTLVFLLSMAAAMVGCGRVTTDHSATRNVFGVDSRSHVPLDHVYAAAGIVGGACAGILVDRRIALTAAHCVYDEFAEGLRPAAPRFTVAGRDHPVSAVIVGSTQPETKRPTDWALLELAQPVLNVQPWGVLSVRLAENELLPWELSFVGGFTAGHAGALTRSTGCAIRKSLGDGRVLHDCDAVAGSSGGALFALEPAIDGSLLPVVVGLAVSERRRGHPTSQHLASYSDDFANVALLPSIFMAQLVRAIEAHAQGSAFTSLAKADPAIDGIVIANSPVQ